MKKFKDIERRVNKIRENTTEKKTPKIIQQHNNAVIYNTTLHNTIINNTFLITALL